MGPSNVLQMQKIAAGNVRFDWKSSEAGAANLAPQGHAGMARRGLW